MNVKLLRKVQKFLLEEPRRFDMRDWLTPSVFANVLNDPPCGTACCIAGAAYLVSKKIAPATVFSRNLIIGHSVSEEATVALGLSEYQVDRLFHLEGWPKKYVTTYYDAKTPLARAKAGVARINHFIKTKGAE